MNVLDWLRRRRLDIPETPSVSEADKIEAEEGKATLDEVRELRKDSWEVHRRFGNILQDNHFSAWLFKTPPVRGHEK